MSEPKPAAAPSLNDSKADWRNSRMKITNSLHERIFEEWQKLSIKACDDEVRAYWVCRQKEGLAVILKCKEQNDAMQNCVADFTRDEEAFNMYKDRRMTEMAEQLEKRKAAYAAEQAKGKEGPK
jgi:Cytochrome c oxidase biogenesis protein Cmc1 like